MTKLILYQLADEFLQAQERLAETDLPDNVIADTLDGLSGAIEVKAQSVATMARNLEATAASIEGAAKEMSRRAALYVARAERIRDYLKSNMERTGFQKIECPYFSIAIKQNPQAVEVDGPLESKWLRFYKAPEPQPDKAKIKEALKAGEVIEGARLVDSTRLEIK